MATNNAVNNGLSGQTGTGLFVGQTSPTLITPALGTPTAIVLTNGIGLPISTGVTGLAANVATFLSTPTSANLAAALTDETGTGANVFSTSPTLVTPLLGIPTSGTLTNCTGLPISTGISGLAAGIATFLATPTSANLAASVTDETGTGSLVFNTSSTFITPILGTPTSGSLTNCTGLPLTTGITGVLGLSNGGSNKALVASNGGIVYTDSDSMEILSATATAGQMLRSGSSSAPTWSTATWPATTTINQLLYSSAANTVGGITTVNSAVLTTNSTGIPAFSSTMTNGQLIIGSTGGTPTAATLTAGNALSITNGAGSITTNVTGGGFGWVEVTGTSQAMTINNAYIANNAGLVTLTIPATLAIGDSFSVVGKGAGGWLVQANTGQTIYMGNQTSSVAGSISSTNRRNCVMFTCITANTELEVRNSIGNIAIS